MKSKVVLALSTALLSLVWLVFSLSSAPAVGKFVPTLLSDKAQTVEGSISNILSIATGDVVHLIWSESTTMTYAYDHDLFYRRLPEGLTINLSKIASTNGSASPATIQPTTGNNVCVMWREIGLDEKYHHYLWRSATNMVSMLPGNVSESNDNLPDFFCDDSNARVGRIDSDSQQVIYWDESVGTQIQVSSSDGYGAGRLWQHNVQNVTYLIWTKYKSGRSYFYIWDSISKSEQEISSSQYVNSIESFIDRNNTVHLIWNVFPDLYPNFYTHWDNVSQIVRMIEPSDVDLISELDGDKNLHSIWAGGYWSSYTVHYWNATENITATIDAVNGVNNLKLVAGPDSTSHMLWQDKLADDLYYANSESLTARFVVHSSYYGNQSNITDWDFDSSGEIHVVRANSPVDWSAKHIVYWTPTLPEPITLTESTTHYSSIDIHIDQQDTIHAVAHTQDNTLYYWNDQMDNMEMVANSVAGYLLTSDADSEGLVIYNNFPGEFHYWSSKIQSSEQLGFSNTYFDVHDSSGWLYLYWAGGQEQYFSDSDMYAAWKPNSDNKHYVYLPAIINP